MQKFVYSTAVGIMYVYLGRTKSQTNDLHCTSRTENHILFHCICISGFFFLFRLLIFLCISLNKTTRNDDDDDAMHMASDLGGAFFFLFTSFLSLVYVQESSANGLPFLLCREEI